LSNGKHLILTIGTRVKVTSLIFDDNC